MATQITRSRYADLMRSFRAFDRCFPDNLSNAMEIHKYVNSKLFPEFVFPGRYPVIYIDRNDDILCANCARLYVLFDNYDPEKDDHIPYFDITKTNSVTREIYYIGSICSCENCSAPIASAYGDVEESEEAVTIDGIEVHPFTFPPNLDYENSESDDIPF